MLKKENQQGRSPLSPHKTPCFYFYGVNDLKDTKAYQGNI
jgi:hypothetical protein